MEKKIHFEYHLDLRLHLLLHIDSIPALRHLAPIHPIQNELVQN